MSTSIHHQQPRTWTPGTATERPAGPSPLVGLAVALRALGAALVPGRAAEDVVPALHTVDAQALLVRAGTLDAGRCSGRWDRSTTDAVALFQRARHLPVTGIADRTTCDALLATPERDAA
ncbi:peptidoglycan-binding domain-containing protein [Patulibacter sp. NPDC049589]|uniref:peptidoglycan-binding domain-containing protein n=1 Tax=Patulibacter sp. NPDC049589 TaxID=3154731 RepID=UPI00341D1017